MNEGEPIDRILSGEAEVASLVGRLDAADAQERKAASVALAEVAEQAPERLEGVGERLVPYLSSDDLSVRMQVSSALAALVGRDPAPALDAVPELEARLADDSPVVRKNVLAVLAGVAATDPAAVEPAVDRVVDSLDSDVAALRQRAVTVLLRVGLESPASLRPHVGRLVARLDDEADPATASPEGPGPDPSPRPLRSERDPLQRVLKEERFRLSAIADGVAVLLATVAETDPTAVEGHADALLAQFDHDRSVVRRSVVEAVAFAGDAGVLDPESAVPALVDRLDDDPVEAVRGRTAWALGLLSERSEVCRARAATALEGNLDLLGADDVEVRTGATTLLTAVVDDHPEVAEAARADAVALLDDESPVVRQHAVYVLGSLGGAADQLERVRDEDPDPDVADLAAAILADHR